MHKKYSILIDGAFLKRKLASEEAPLSASRVLQFTNKLQNRPEFEGLKLHRIYYYDSEPLKGIKSIPLTGGGSNSSKFDFSKTATYQSNLILLNELKKLPYFAVRLGEVNFRGWNVKQQRYDISKKESSITITKDDLIPNVQQKGVDMRIGLDIASLTLKDHTDIIALVSGDSDFIPALKFARREGKQSFFYTLGHRIKPTIHADVDLCIENKAEMIDKIAID